MASRSDASHLLELVLDETVFRNELLLKYTDFFFVVSSIEIFKEKLVEI